MKTEYPDLPVPPAAALALSAALVARIRDEIAAAGGWIGFDRYMARALYEPGLGYYSAGSTKFGASGDFVTAPELGDTLADALAAQIAPLFARLERPVLLELGAGLGTLARQLLDALEARGMPRVVYQILEPSADLAARQRETLAVRAGQVAWLERLPETPFEGVMVANEVVDALPAACFIMRGGRARPLGVIDDDDGFAWGQGGDDAELETAVAAVEAALGRSLAEGYRSEIRLQQAAWLGALAQSVRRGAMFLVDYGHSREDYYHIERSAGTLVTHYRHRVLDDPFFRPGLADLTAWVDFSALADAARTAGFALAGYTTQAQFLLESLGAELIVPPTSLQALSALKTLVFPGEMGERFKVALFTKDFDVEFLPGRDFRDRL